MKETLRIATGVFATLLVLASSSLAGAQTFGGAFDGMSGSKEPVQIEADRLEVIDEKGTAVFSGNVTVTQGTTRMTTSRLKVLYGRDSKGKVGPGGNVRVIEASGGVGVRSKDQVASADKATVNMETQIANLSGNVSVSQGNNILTGCVVTIDMRTNNIKVEPCKSKSGGGGRIKMQLERAPGKAQ